MATKPLAALFAALTAAACVLPAAVADDPPDSVAEQIRGDWVQYRDTPQGRYTTIKEHTGDQTALTTYDPKGQAVYAHKSDYRVDDSGDVNVFRYKNRQIVLGPDAGPADPQERAYLFRVEGDQFIEVHGMMQGDTGKPSLTIWQRLKVNPFRQPDA